MTRNVPTHNIPFQLIENRDLTRREARNLTRQINSDWEKTVFGLVQACIGRAWIALGYELWDDYVKEEIHVPHLPRDTRRAVVAFFRSQGMSTRAIGAATSKSHTTVQRDLEAGGTNVPPDEEVTGLDGKTYPASREPDDEEDDVIDAEVVPPQEETTCPTCGGTGRILQ